MKPLGMFLEVVGGKIRPKVGKIAASLRFPDSRELCTEMKP